MCHASDAVVRESIHVGIPNGDSCNAESIRQQHMAPHWVGLSWVYDNHNRLETETHPRVGLNAGQIARNLSRH